MELNLPEHWGYGFTIDREEDTYEGDDISVDLISSDFHVIDIIVDDTYEYWPYGADCVHDI